ncbi:hypothetical protein [Polaribacter porphyrae]|uniref:RiboL-PSP-HEPN domain-containing protein n=1 Tax=Polaribacter porphyrae TaxID=1137780 RepID=A0A2S7WT86_9FLAO|nr:hypothetical protein [Polaribacter porphyrae]PQJ80818.1 hypothetical protein BTO18_17285 [Polaribacter porphyrae]
MKKDYSERSDLEKIKSNWNKVNGLYERKEWSTVILRASTSVELSANLVIRNELQNNKNNDSDFVSHLLIWANGIRGKFDKLLIPIFKGSDFEKELKKLNTKAQNINQERNSIAHSGQFKEKSTAEKIIKESQLIIETLIKQYHKDFELKKILEK